MGVCTQKYTCVSCVCISGDESSCLLSLFAHTSMPAHICREELITVSLLWVSEPTDPRVLFRPKKLVRGKGDLGSGNAFHRTG